MRQSVGKTTSRVLLEKTKDQKTDKKSAILRYSWEVTFEGIFFEIFTQIHEA